MDFLQEITADLRIVFISNGETAECRPKCSNGLLILEVLPHSPGELRALSVAHT
jgi:hypothetical protein